jgi:hypothetical protein
MFPRGAQWLLLVSLAVTTAVPVQDTNREGPEYWLEYGNSRLQDTLKHQVRSNLPGRVSLAS